MPKRKIAKILSTVTKYRKTSTPFAVGALVILLPIFLLSIKNKESVLADSSMQFDEGFGSTTSDTTVSGTITNAVWRAEELCASNKCLYFDGTGDFVNYGDDADLDFVASDSFTIEGWFRTGDITSGQRTIIAKYNTSGGYKVYMDSNGYLLFGIDNDNTGFPSDSVTTSPSVFDDNKWHHFAAIKNGTTDITLYVDNVQFSTDSTITSATLVNSDSFYVGIDGDGTSNGWTGFIDEVKVYRSARTVTQIKSDYAGITTNRGTTASFGPNQRTTSNGLVGYWKMNENTGATIADSSGNGNNATTTSQFWTTGKFGPGLNVGGTTDYINAGSASSLDDPTSWTLSLWVRSECAIEAYDDRILEKAATTGIDTSITAETCTVRAVQAVSGTDPVSVTSTGVGQNVWTHLSIVYNDETRYISIYFDGIEQPYSTRTQGASSSTTVSDAAGNFLLGNRSAFDRGYLGTMDEVRFYNRALTASEVSNLYTFAPGPTAYWKMDERTGIYAYDTSGNNYTGSWVGTGNKWGEGKYGSAGTLTPSAGDSLSISTNVATFKTLAQGTITLWFKTSAAGYLLGAGGVGATPDLLMYLGNYTGGYPDESICIHFIDNSSTNRILGCYRNSHTALTDNNWHHISYTVNNDGTGNSLYIDGIKVPMSYIYGASSSEGYFLNDSSFTTLDIGNFKQAGSYQGGITGKIDEIKIYNYARTPKQVIEDMNGTHPAGGSPIGSQIIHWSFDEGNGTGAGAIHNTVTSQQSLTGNLSGGIWNIATNTVNCKLNNCVYLDSFNDYVSAGDPTFLDSISGFTTSMWIQPDGLQSSNTDILSKYNGSGQNNFAIRITTDEIKVCISSTISDNCTNYFTTSNFNLANNTWTHLAVVYNGAESASSRVRVYKNGLQIQGTVTGTIPASTPANTTSELRLGDASETGSNSISAYFDELKIYNSALSQNEILVDANFGSGTSMGGVATQTNEGFGGNPPVVWWKLDDNTGATAIDSSGNDKTINFGASTAAPTWTQGNTGTAFKFDGINDYAVTAGSINLSSETTITVEFWLNWDSYANDDDLAMEFTPNLNSNSGGFIIDPNFSTSGTFAAWQMNSSGTPSGAHFTRPSAGSWHHYAIIFDKTAPSATDTIPYVDGAPISYTKQYTATMDNTFTNNSLYIMSRAGTSLFGAGKMDDIKIYNYARTSAQIAYDYNRGAPIAKYDMDECSGATIHNATINSNKTQIAAYDGTFNLGASGQTSLGTCTVNANTPWYNGRIGKYSSSLNFDGTDDYIDIPDNTNLRLTKDITLSAWVKTTNASAEVILNKGTSNGGESNFNLSVGQASAGKVTFWVTTGGTLNTSNKTVNDGNWHHIVVTFSPDNDSVKIYIDGKLDSTHVNTATPYGSTCDILIGARDDSSPGNCGTSLLQYFNGQIDSVGIYNYTLNATQVTLLYNEGSSIRFGQ